MISSIKANRWSINLPNLSLFTPVSLSFITHVSLPVDVKHFFTALDVSESVFAAFLCRQILVSAGCDVTQTSRDRAANVHAEAPASRSSGETLSYNQTGHSVLMSLTWRCSSRAPSSGWWGHLCSWTSPLGFWARPRLCPPSPGSLLYPNPPESHTRSHGRCAWTHTQTQNLQLYFCWRTQVTENWNCLVLKVWCTKMSKMVTFTTQINFWILNDSDHSFLYFIGQTHHRKGNFN